MPRRWAALATLVLLTAPFASADARSPRATDFTERLLDVARTHRESLEASIPRREQELREAIASLDRSTTLYARGLITRSQLDRAARDAGEAKTQLDWARQELVRAGALIAELEARRRLASLPPLRPGQYEATDGLVRFAGARPFSLAMLGPLEQFFTLRVGRPLPVSAAGQTEFHTRLGLDHGKAADVALHPDSTEGQLVMRWLREQGISFTAFRGARQGAASGAHIHVGPPSERLVAPATRATKRARPEAGAPAEASGATGPAAGPATQIMTR